MSNNIGVACIAFAASVLMIFFTYLGCQQIFKFETYFSEWERRNNCRIIKKEYNLFFRNWHHLIVEDSSGNRQSAWVRFRLFSGKDKTVWD